MIDVSTGFHVYRDGTAWCAVGPTFEDLQVSNAGFGDEIEEAIEALRHVLREQGRPLPRFDAFRVHLVGEDRKLCDRYAECEQGLGTCWCLSEERADRVEK